MVTQADLDRLNSILTGGAAGRANSITGLAGPYQDVISRMLAAAPPEIAPQLQISSGFRSPELQAQLWNNAVKKYGSESAARKWVAPPGRSQHGFGNAIDWKFGSDAAREWAHANAGKFGGSFPLSNEPWHMELAGARGGGGTAPSPAVAGGTTLTSVPGQTAVPLAPDTGATAAVPVTSAAEASSGLETLLSAFTGGGKRQAEPASTQIAPSSIGSTVGAGPQAASGASALMAALMADKRSQYGLSLGMV